MPPQASDVALEYPPQASDEALEHSTQALDEEFEHEWRSPSYVISSYSSLHGALGNVCSVRFLGTRARKCSSKLISWP